MWRAVEPIYETLFGVIETLAGEPNNPQATGTKLFKSFDRGFWFREDCKHKLDEFPYAFLDQPTTTQIDEYQSPSVFQYDIDIPLFILIHKHKQSNLFFNETSDPDGPGVVELARSIGGEFYRLYKGGLPFQPPPIDWHVIRWTLGDMRRPRLAELTKYLDNDFIAGVEFPFIFRVRENGPIGPGGN